MGQKGREDVENKDGWTDGWTADGRNKEKRKKNQMEKAFKSMTEISEVLKRKLTNSVF